MSDAVTEQNREKVRSFYEKLFTGDTSGAGDLIGPDFVAYEPASLPYGGVYRGLEGFFQVMTALRESWKGMQFEIDRYSADQDLVFVHLKFAAKGRTSGIPYETRIIEVWRLENGVAVEQHIFFADTKAAVDVLEGTVARAS